MITDFPSNPLANFAGASGFSFAPFQYISGIPVANAKVISAPLVFYAGLSFLKGYSTQDKLSFTEKTSKDDNGTVYSWTINGFMPGDDDETLSLMSMMADQQQFLVLVTDNSGRLRLVGINAPLDFDFTYDSGLEPGQDAKGYSYTFSGQGIVSAPFYNV